MRVTAPVTDYIRASVMSVRGDLAVRGLLVPERLAAGADKTYFQGKGAGVIPAYSLQMPPLVNTGDLLVRGGAVPQRLAVGAVGTVLTGAGAGALPLYKSLFNWLTTRGDIWIRGAAAVQKLAAGALNTYFKSQGAGNLPIYEKLALRDTGVKIGSGTRNSAGDQVITGIGYRPSIIIFFAVDSLSSNVNLSWGFDNGTEHYCTNITEHGANVGSNFSKSLYLSSSMTGTLTGYVSALGSDGFTITWTLGATMSCIFIYLCLP